jgi:hypothetical protein
MTTRINSLKENFSFELLDYEIEHQGQAVIDIAVDMDYKEGIGQKIPLNILILSLLLSLLIIFWLIIPMKLISGKFSIKI